jgi:hypothetical protein
MPRSPFSKALEGRELVGENDIPTLKALYQLGDFRYQVFGGKNWASKIKTCDRYDTVEWLERQLRSGSRVVIEVPQKKAQ